MYLKAGNAPEELIQPHLRAVLINTFVPNNSLSLLQTSQCSSTIDPKSKSK